MLLCLQHTDRLFFLLVNERMNYARFGIYEYIFNRKKETNRSEIRLVR